ncbi:MAG: primosomal protein N' [Burkholderiales bacterium]|nr:primosomal protein N' [Burkholderiales bacterium]
MARVALDVPVHGLFDYLAPDDLSCGDIGSRVQVPFGNRQRVGVIIELATTSGIADSRLKPLTRILRDVPPLSPDLLSLLRFCSDYYHHPLGQVVMNALPTALRAAKPIKQRLKLAFRLSEAGRERDDSMLPRRHVVKRRLLAHLRQSELAEEEARAISPRAIKALLEMSALGWVEKIAAPVATSTRHAEIAEPRLTAEQQAGVDAILAEAPGFNVWLLHGITGSGKTEIYMRVIAHVLEAGEQALVLVPEIALTPQLESRFRARFPQANLVTLHSSLAAGERTANWLAAQAGRAQIVLGTRLAVFTPLARLGLIVVDEEQDSSFKQHEGLRYSARDLAIFRARQQNARIVLGSATPALETYYNARAGRFRMLRLTARAAAGAELPSVRCIDVSREPLVDGLSKVLLEAIAARFERGEQSLVFINRRGYSPVLMCSACGWKSACARCASYLVLHLRERRLRCHLCGHQEAPPIACPACGNQDITAIGHGTQRVEAALTRLFPGARILRVDSDSVRRKSAWQGMLTAIGEGRIDILVGTQMLAKGHDFAGLTLVGVLNADSSLYSSDWRASERLFAQLIQVSGRAGRAATRGEVLIQTQFAGHPLYSAVIAHDYTAFAETLLAERERAGFPPYVYQTLLRAEARAFTAAQDFLAAAAQSAARLGHPGIKVFEPVTAQPARVAGMERAQLLVQSPSRQSLQAFLTLWHPQLLDQKGKKIRWSLDVDPLEF